MSIYMTATASQPLPRSWKRGMWSRNNPHPSHVCHIAGLSQVVCSTVDPQDTRAVYGMEPNTQMNGRSRHTPQTKYVSVLKGLNDIPVCTVLEKLSEMEQLVRRQKDHDFNDDIKRFTGGDLMKNRMKQRIRFLDYLWNRTQSCPDGLRVDEIGDFKLELVRRHNPHARRVCHIKGLNDVPVCVVRDELNVEWENRFIVSPGSLAPAYSKPKKKWLDSMRNSYPEFVHTDRTDRSTSRTSSRISVPKMSLIPPEQYENDLSDELDSIQALDILCSILQTNSLQTVQAWIDQATDEERHVVLRALREMKDKGAFMINKNLPVLPEDKVSLSYQSNWNQTKSLEEAVERPAPKPPVPAPTQAAETVPPKSATPTVGTQTPVLSKRPPTRIQMTGLSRPSTMKSVREKFMSGRTGPAVKDPGFSWTVKHRDSIVSPSNDVASKA